MPSTLSTPKSYVDEQGRSNAEVYLTDIYDGKIVASKHMRKLSEIMLPRFHEEYHGFHFSQQKADRVCRFIEEFTCFPEGEKMGKPFLLEDFQQSAIQLAYGFVDENDLREFRQILMVLARKNGKALGLDTEIPTPDGWRTMRDIHPGDYVFGQDGKPSKVLVESEIFDKPMYLVTFADHATVKASSDHIWTVRSNGRKMDVTTDELMTMVESAHVSVPMCEPVEYECERKYVNLFEVHELVQSGKPLPDDMLTSGMSLRSGLVYVFVETYGVGPRSRMTPAEPYDLSCVPESQVWQLVEVASSLGMLASASVDGYRTYHVTIHPIAGTKQVVSVTRIPNEPSKCIAIDNPSHLYLVGRQYTATHNTSLLAALCLYHLTSDGANSLGGEIYACATGESQARKCFGAADAMRRHSPALAKRVFRGMVQKRGVSGLNYPKLDSSMVALSSSVGRLDGLSSSMCCYDEIGAATDGGALLDLMEESTSARPEAITWLITTQNYVRDNIFDERLNYSYGWLDGTIHDDRFLPLLYMLDSRDEIYDESKWPKANPGLLCGIKSWDYLRDRVNKAKQSPARMPSLLTKEFNLLSNSYSAFLDINDCVNKETFEFTPDQTPYAIVGFDLASKGDLNACVVRMMVPGDDRIYEFAKFWIPEESVKINSAKDFKERDQVPYHQWAADGWIDIVEGDRVNQYVIIEYLRELVDLGIYPYAVAYDPWHVDDYTERELKRLVGESRVHGVPQTARVISPLLRESKLDLKAKRVICPSPVLHFCRASCQVREDNNSNLFPQKRGLDSRKKIDGYMAELFAMYCYKLHEEDFKVAIGWVPPE